jgi:hypothetical protein
LQRGPQRHPLGLLADGYVHELMEAACAYLNSAREWDDLAEMMAALRLTAGALEAVLHSEAALGACVRLEQEVCRVWEADLRARRAAAAGGEPCSP